MELNRRIDSRAAMRSMERVYGEADAARQLRRYKLLAQKFFDTYHNDHYVFFSASGRTELIGNHTDHNNGMVLSAGINLDTIAAAAKTENNHIRITSEGFDGEFSVSLSDLSPQYQEKNTTSGLIRGIAARFAQLGLNIGGFEACVTSNVLRGSGLSSSASVEVLICTILSVFYNDGLVDCIDIAKISQYAENNYFGKPCGLMDQLASAAGSILAIDFKNNMDIRLEPVKYDFTRKGYSIIITDVHSDHADLTGEYAAITKEMADVAEYFGQKKLIEVNETTFYNSVYELYGKVPDRAILRAIHFFEENKRVQAAVDALENDSLQIFFDAVISSGNSSWRLLQNLYVPAGKSQALTVALAVSQHILQGRGAWRVHGGGFGGTALAFVPIDLKKTYVSEMNRIFGENAATELSVRPCGALMLDF